MVETMQELTDIEKAYIAGIVDGEGYIGILKGKLVDPRKICPYTLKVSVTNTDLKLIYFLKERLGVGSITKVPANYRFSRRPWYQYVVQANNALKLLSMVRPYMIIKNIQAGIAIEFQEKRWGRHGRGIKRPEEETIFLEDCLQRLKRERI